MDTKQISTAIDKSALKISKEKLLESIRKSNEKDLLVLRDNASNFMIIKVKSQ